MNEAVRACHGQTAATVQARAAREDHQQPANDFDQQNLPAALEVLQTADKHGGDEDFAAIWARAVIRRLEGEVLR